MISPLVAGRTVELNVGKMHCANYVQAVETRLLRQPGVISAAVDLATEIVTVECTVEVNPVAIAARLTEAGFPSQLQNSKAELIRNIQRQNSRKLYDVAIA